MDVVKLVNQLVNDSFELVRMVSRREKARAAASWAEVGNVCRFGPSREPALLSRRKSDRVGGENGKWKMENGRWTGARRDPSRRLEPSTRQEYCKH